MNGSTKTLPTLLIVIFLFALLPLVGREAHAADEKWIARYYNNLDVSGDPKMKREEEAIDHDWGDGSPGGGVHTDEFSARWTRTIFSNAGVYRFSATMDDGMRVWVDGGLLIDEWQDGQVRTVSVDMPLTHGEHEIEVRYYEAGGKAVAKFWYGVAQGPPSPPVNRWQGLYFNNQTLSGPPAFTRSDSDINFNWKQKSPWSTIQHDHFSARWSGNFDHTPGTYRFTVRTDDGVRLWVNNQLLIDQWHVNQDVTYQADAPLPGGSVPLRLEYFEQTGAALIVLTAEIAGGGSGSAGATPALPPPDLAGGQAVITNANWLSVRSAPEIGDNVITAAARGTVVQLIGRNGGWVKVRLPNGIEGWVGSSYLAGPTPLNSLPVIQ